MQQNNKKITFYKLAKQINISLLNIYKLIIDNVTWRGTHVSSPGNNFI